MKEGARSLAHRDLYTFHTPYKLEQTGIKIIKAHHPGRHSADEAEGRKSPQGADKRGGDQKNCGPCEKGGEEKEALQQATLTGGTGKGQENRRTETQAGGESSNQREERGFDPVPIENPMCLLHGTGGFIPEKAVMNQEG
jgi:hypothetical protein